METGSDPYARVKQATLDGIEQASQSVPPHLEAAAMAWIAKYVKQRQYFTGGQILDAWRKEPGNGPNGLIPEAHVVWRDWWGWIVTKGRREGYYEKVGRKRPRTRQSHVNSLVMWHSLHYEGPDEPVETPKDRLKALRKQVVLRELDVMQALWKAYEMGIDE